MIGVGQALRGDDAAGLEAVRRWQEMYPVTANQPGVQVELCELPGLGLLDSLAGVEAAILVDAILADRPTGSLLCVQPDALDSFESGALSAHGWGISETLQLGRRLDPSLMNYRIILVGIVAGQLTPGGGLSAELQAGLSAAVEMIEQEVRMLLGDHKTAG